MCAEGVRQTWGRYAPAFAAEGTGAEDRPSLRRLVELCGLSPGAVALDVGTGAGYTAFVLARTGVRVVGVDPTHEMLLTVREGWRDRELDGAASVVESWAEDLPFADGSVEGVVCHRAAHQFADVGAFVSEVRRCLRPGGVLGVADQSPPDGWEEWHNALERERDPTHAHARSPMQWRALVEGAGLEVAAAEVVHQQHDLESWLDRVSCPPDRRREVRRMLDGIPDAIRDAYRPEEVDGAVRFRTPQLVMVAVRRR